MQTIYSIIDMDTHPLQGYAILRFRISSEAYIHIYVQYHLIGDALLHLRSTKIQRLYCFVESFLI